MHRSISLAIFISILLLVPLIQGRALEQEFVLGEKDKWRDFVVFENIVKLPGKWGSLDLRLMDAQYKMDETTDMLIHFNAVPASDESGHYTITGKNQLVTDKESMFGRASGVFQNSGGIELAPEGNDALFAQGNVWDEFTLEFWLCPVHLSNDESIIDWEGAMRKAGKTVSQHFRCTVRKRKLVWELNNLFGHTDGTISVRLEGIRELVPRAWHHHMLRFDGSSGLLEYLIDGVPEAVTHTTASGRETTPVYHPTIGTVLPIRIRIARQYTGYLDELRLSRSFIGRPVLKKFDSMKGRAESRVFDLEGSGSRTKEVKIDETLAADSHVGYFIRTSDTLFSHEHAFDIPWIEFDPAKGFENEIRGRYVQLSFEMFPDGTKNFSPSVSRIVLVAEPQLSPPPPIGLAAEPGNGKVTLRWKRVNHESIKGYRIYYGDGPGSYDHSPIDAGSAVEFEVTGLENGALYFFTVVAYDTNAIPNVSGFSNEVSARPRGLYK